MRIDGQEFAGIVPRCTAELAQGDLQAQGLGDRMAGQQLVDGQVAGDKG